jgi:DNA-binding XRE family transcriptional regulator
MISFLSLCDKPDDMFKIISRAVFIEQWPSIRKKWAQLNTAQDYLHWWDSIYRNLVAGNRPLPVEEQSVHLKLIGVQIRRARLRKEWNQSDLADQVHMSQRKISKIENGKVNVTIETLLKIARVLGIDRIDLALEGARGEGARGHPLKVCRQGGIAEQGPPPDGANPQSSD